MRINWSYEARIDLKAARDYIKGYNPVAAQKTVAKIYQKIRILKDHPSIGRPGKTYGTRELVIAPYIAVYRIQDNSIEILRLYHGAQDWPEDE